jgi:hypothetical protein
MSYLSIISTYYLCFLNLLFQQLKNLIRIPDSILQVSMQNTFPYKT